MLSEFLAGMAGTLTGRANQLSDFRDHQLARPFLGGCHLLVNVLANAMESGPNDPL